MMYMIIKLLFLIFINLFIIGCVGGDGSTDDSVSENEADITTDNNSTTIDSSQVELIGNPFINIYPDDPFARNVWDMHVFNDRVYFGVGNSANEGPSQNVGPVPVVSYDGYDFQEEFLVDDEQIDIFKTFNNTLYIPGHDATQSWSYGNLYLKELGSSWEKRRTLPDAIHVMDLAYYNDKIYAALGVEYIDDEEKEILASDDNGLTWELNSVSGFGRIYSFLQVSDQLFAVKLLRNSEYNSLFQLNSITNIFEAVEYDDLHINILLPDISYDLSRYKVYRVQAHESKTFYIGAGKYNDFHPLPLSLYMAQFVNSKLKSNRIELENNYTPRDILLDGNTLYLLAAKENELNVTNVVLKTDINSINFKELVSFEYKTFARSFEKYNNDFYFGIGYDVNTDKDVSEEVEDLIGNILKISID